MMEPDRIRPFEMAAASRVSPQPWLRIVGIGEDGWEGLGKEARDVITAAELLYGGARHLSHVPASVQATRIAWPSPMGPAVQEILDRHRRQRQIVVLASGDPMLYGVGVTFTRHLDLAEFQVIPQVSAFSLACARMGWALAETSLISLVHRPIEQLRRYLFPGQQIVIYSENGSTPQAIAVMLTASGYGTSLMHVFAHLGGQREKHELAMAQSWTTECCEDLNLVAFTCIADADTRILPLIPGLPEDAFESDGQLTKREVRAVTLASLAPLPGQKLWDVGAGTGTIGIEWMRTHPSCTCTAFEQRADRAERILTNARRLGVPSLRVIPGTAPLTFPEEEAPDAIFLGGGLSRDGLFEACWKKLKHHGRLVANAVTVESEVRLAAWHAQYGGEMSRIQVTRAEPVGGMIGWKPQMPVTQWVGVKR